MELTLQEVLQKAFEAHKAGQIQEANRLYTAILQAQPKHPDANHNMGVLAVSVGKIQEALPFFKIALEANPSVGQYWLSCIDALINLDRIIDAKSVFDQAKSKGASGEAFDQLEQRLNVSNEVSIDPQQDQLNTLINLYQQGQLQQTLDSAKQLLSQFPNSLTLYNIQGTANSGLGQHNAAIDSYKEALKINPDYADAYNNMDVALNNKGDLDAALDSYKQALKIKPDHAEAHSSLAFVLIGIGNRDEALLNLKRSHELIRGKNPVNPYHNSFLTISKAKMDHDIDQFKYLADSGYEAAKFNALADLYRDVSLKIDWSIGEIQPLSNKHQKLLKNTYNRPINVLEAPEVLNGPISTTLDRGNITKGYSKHDHGLTYIDNFLTPSALDSIREFLLGSTIWHDIKEGGYLGAYLRDGLACPLLLQIANELRVAFPEIFKGHQLLHLWAYKYDSGAYKDDNGLTGIRAHADEAAVNVNFWITPATANLNPESGGLIVYNKLAPLEWDFKKFNSNHEEIAKHLNYGSCEKTIVPYNENRAVIFNSNLIHETDKFEFKEGYENRRINITMLFGHRGD